MGNFRGNHLQQSSCKGQSSANIEYKLNCDLGRRGKYLVCCLFEKHIGTSLYQKIFPDNHLAFGEKLLNIINDNYSFLLFNYRPR